ncbi:Zinc finger protein 24 [Merluccius polli]|uniref:Zinc finger protein 24 n=1 Tax=Merluccius polli TaxID=89951 RepID=A0AA47N9L7_MERPO|nr:Zinc finger protein 24 [Merluccius polli]
MRTPGWPESFPSTSWSDSGGRCLLPPGTHQHHGKAVQTRGAPERRFGGDDHHNNNNPNNNNHNKMSPPVEFHAQLASIMEVLANAAVAEICELVDNGYAVLHLEISRGHKENEALRRKLRLMELKVARVSALRAAGVGSSIFASSRARASHLGGEPRRNHASELDRRPGIVAPVLPAPVLQPRYYRPVLQPRYYSLGELPLPRITAQLPLLCGDPEPPADPGQGAGPRKTAPVNPVKIQTPVIKVEKEDEPWQQDKGFHDDIVHNGDPNAEAPPPLAKQEVVTKKDVGSRSCSWDGPSPTPLTPTKHAQSGGGGGLLAEAEDADGYDCMMYDEPQAQHASFLPDPDPSPEEEEPGCSYAVGSSRLSVPAPSEPPALRFPFSLGDVAVAEPQPANAAGFPDGGQRGAPPLPPPADEPHTANRKEVPAVASAFVMQDDWLAQEGFGGAYSSRDDPAGGKTFICSFCGKTLACLKNLKTHIRVHTGEKPFSCSLCGKRFSDSSNLKRHQSVHTGEKRYGCVHCGKRFAQSGSLKVHMSVHTGCKQFTCPYCNKTFISANHLRRHIILHGADKQLPAMFH